MKQKTRIYRKDPVQGCLPGFVNRGERPGPKATREEWLSYMAEREQLIAAHRAPDSCVEASYGYRSTSSTLRLENCGSLWMERAEGEELTWSPLRCRSRWCPSCANIWRMPIIEAFTQAINETQRVTLVTLTGGRSCYPNQLKDRIQGMSRALRRWKRRAKRDGVEGGVYAWEVTQAEDKRLHAHLHLSIVYSPAAEWAEADRLYVESGARHGGISPALIWLALSWASALEREAPDLYADLPFWRDLLPSMQVYQRILYGEVEAARGAVADIGSRWPDPNRKGEQLLHLGAGDSKKNLEQTVKYAIKNGAEIDTAGWVQILQAFKGRRRIQAWGCLFGVKPPEDPDQDVTRSELTGNAAAIGGGRVNDLSEILKSFLWGSTISHAQPTRNEKVLWFRCRLEGGE